MLDVVERLRAARRIAQRRHADRGGRRLRLLPGKCGLLALVHLRRVRAADRRRGRPAAPARTAASPAPRRRPVRAPEAPDPAPAAPHDRRGHRRAGQGPRRRRRRVAPPRLGRSPGVGFAPVQDRHAAPAIAAALRELAAIEDVEVVIVARGGGSLADLFAFCDEALCRTVALLRVPVISSVGHHTDRTLIDDVAAVSCSTPTHAAEAAVPIDCRAARADVAAYARRLHGHGRERHPPPGQSTGPSLARPESSRGPQPAPPAPAAARAARQRPPRLRLRPRSGRNPSARAQAHGHAARRRATLSAGARTSNASRSRSPPTTRIARSPAATRLSATAPASRWAAPPRHARQETCACVSTTASSSARVTE